VVTSLVVGFAVWAYTLLMPALLQASGSHLAILREGPSHRLAATQALFGASAMDPLTNGVFWSRRSTWRSMSASRC